RMSNDVPDRLHPARPRLVPTRPRWAADFARPARAHREQFKSGFGNGSCQTDSRNPPGQYGLILLVGRNTTFPSGRTTKIARSPAMPFVTYPNSPLTGVLSASRPSSTKWSSLPTRRVAAAVAQAAPHGRRPSPRYLGQPVGLPGPVSFAGGRTSP